MRRYVGLAWLVGVISVIAVVSMFGRMETASSVVPPQTFACPVLDPEPPLVSARRKFGVPDSWNALVPELDSFKAWAPDGSVVVLARQWDDRPPSSGCAERSDEPANSIEFLSNLLTKRGIELVSVSPAAWQGEWRKRPLRNTRRIVVRGTAEIKKSRQPIQWEVWLLRDSWQDEQSLCLYLYGKLDANRAAIDPIRRAILGPVESDDSKLRAAR